MADAINITDIAPLQTPADLCSDDEWRSYLKQEHDEETEIPWKDADPTVLPFIAGFDANGQPLQTGTNAPASGIVFGADSDPDFANVNNWVQVDDLGGLGALYCGSAGGKFFLTTTASTNTETSEVKAAKNGEEKEMSPASSCGDAGGINLACGLAPLPRVACPMELRDRVLKVDNRWRSDVWWDTLINGITCKRPPEANIYNNWTNPFRYFTLRCVQVGRYLCFHTVISTPEVNITTTETGWVEEYEVKESQYYDIGYSSRWHGLPRINYGLGIYSGFPEVEGTAEPPWGENISNSWQGTSDSTSRGGEFDYTAGWSASVNSNGMPGHSTPGGYLYCRIYPRINASAGWGDYDNINPKEYDVKAIEEHLFGLSPEWVEERLGISEAFGRNGEEWTKSGVPDYSVYRNLGPAGEWVRVLEANLPLSPLGDIGSVYIALYTAAIDNCLLTASVFAPYNYTVDPTS